MSHPARLASPIALACLLALVASPAEADIVGFGDGDGFTLNGNNNGLPTIAGGVLTLTNGLGSETRSAFDDTPQGVLGFAANFTYTDADKGAADGFAFVIQGVAPTALGGGGAGLGYDGMPRSVAVLFSLLNPLDATGLGVNGSSPLSTPPASLTSISPINLASGDPIAVALAYNATTLTENLTDLTTSLTFSLSYTVNIAAATGSNLAFVGFSGGTGAGTSTQRISNFTFSVMAVPEPSALGLLGLGLLGLAGRLRRVATPAIAR